MCKGTYKELRKDPYGRKSDAYGSTSLRQTPSWIMRFMYALIKHPRVGEKHPDVFVVQMTTLVMMPPLLLIFLLRVGLDLPLRPTLTGEIVFLTFSLITFFVMRPFIHNLHKAVHDR